MGEKAAAHGAAEEESESEHGAVADASAIADLDPFIVNLADSPEIRYLKVTMKVEADNAGTVEQIKARTRKFAMRFSCLLTSLDSATARSPQGKAQVARRHHRTDQRPVAQKIGEIDVLHRIRDSITRDVSNIMDKILSQEEIDALMGGVMSGDVETAPKEKEEPRESKAQSDEPGADHSRAHAHDGDRSMTASRASNLSLLDQRASREDRIQRPRHADHQVRGLHPESSGAVLLQSVCHGAVARQRLYIMDAMLVET